MVRNLWTVVRPNMTEKKFEKVTEQDWAKNLKLGTHRLRQGWVQKRLGNLDEILFPKPFLRTDCLTHSLMPATMLSQAT